MKSAPAAANAAAKKKAATKPKGAGAGSTAPDGDMTGAPDTPVTIAGTPTATLLDSPKKNKGVAGGTGKKKKATNDMNGLPTINIMTTF